ncbi:MAG: threonine synthase, partial [Candidatus Hydrothermarchaeota archaeon]
MSNFALRCIGCGKEYPPEEVIFKCTCGGLLEVALDLEALEVRREGFQGRLGVWRYRPFMPIREGARIITLQEGGTPLYRAERLGDAI